MTRLKLDLIDLKILAELQRNGRITKAALADVAGLSPSPCLQRVKRLEAAGVILGYSARVDLGALGGDITVFTEVTLADHTRRDFADFEVKIAQEEDLVECHLISGGYDYLLKFNCEDLADYQSTIEIILDRIPGISKYFSYIVIKTPVPTRPRMVKAGPQFAKLKK